MVKVMCVETGNVYPSKKEAAEALGLTYTKLISAIRYGKEVNGFHVRLAPEESKTKRDRHSNSHQDLMIQSFYRIYCVKSKDGLEFVTRLNDSLLFRDAEWVQRRSCDFITLTEVACADENAFLTNVVELLFRYSVYILMTVWDSASSIGDTWKQAEEMGRDAFLDMLEHIGQSLEERAETLEPNPYGCCNEYVCYQSWITFAKAADTRDARLAAVDSFIKRVSVLRWDEKSLAARLAEKNEEVERLSVELEEARSTLRTIKEILEP